VSYAKGWGKLKSPTEVEVTAEDGTTRVLSGKNIIIATGSEVMPLPGSPVDEEK
jgi:dihydrolipoamide dehydrogenase